MRDQQAVSGDATHAFLALGPETLLDAVESVAGHSDGRVLALNSFENRVYQVGLEDRDPIIVKFYRPLRWSDEAIREEHDVTLRLAQAELAVAAPLRDRDGETLHRFGPFRFALYRRLGGRAPELERPGTLPRLGRLLARVHNVAEQCPFRHRPRLDAMAMGRVAVDFVAASGQVPASLEAAYQSTCRDVLARIEAALARARGYREQPLHGDCHLGNILWREDEPWLLDFDDACTGPAVQDLWMLLSGGRDDMTRQLDALLGGYTQFRDFDARQLNLIEPLRSLRIMRHAAWIGQRWSDPAFPRAFPDFAEPRFWEQHVLALREQLALMDEPPLPWP